MTKTYAGIGARLTPLDKLVQMTYLSMKLCTFGLKLRSGGARGADLAFMNGAFLQGGAPAMRIYTADQALKHPEWYAHASLFHPKWSDLSPYAQSLMARNSPILLGSALTDPVKFVVCWTPDGKVKGGTGQGLRIAQAYGIPVVNLAVDAEDKIWKVMYQ